MLKSRPRTSLWLLAQLFFMLSLLTLTAALYGATKTCNLREYPFMVGIVPNPFKEGALDITCGGSLVHPKVVLTAASCIEDKDDLHVAVGLWLTRPVIIAVEYIRLHPGWINQEKKIKDNVGVIILEEEVQRVKLLRLPKRGFYGEFRLACPYAEIISMGEIEPGRKIILPGEPFSCGKMRVIDEYQCEQAYPALGKIFFKSTICTYNEDNSMGVFRSDAGSPLICGSVQVGIVSFAIRYKVPLPNVFTRVDQYVKWIRDKFPKRPKPFEIKLPFKNRYGAAGRWDDDDDNDDIYENNDYNDDDDYDDDGYDENAESDDDSPDGLYDGWDGVKGEPEAGIAPDEYPDGWYDGWDGVEGEPEAGIAPDDYPDGWDGVEGKPEAGIAPDDYPDGWYDGWDGVKGEPEAGIAPE